MMKFCQGCSTPFHCQSSIDCWCNKKLFTGEKIAHDKLNLFSTDGLGCYCPRCLDDVLNDAAVIDERDTLHI